MRFDEKWDFVGEKEKNCETDETTAGDCWDHAALDPESRLVVSLVVGKRTAEATHRSVRDFHRRTGGRIPRLIASDGDPVCADAIRVAYGCPVMPPRTGKAGRPRSPYSVLPPAVTCATVHKEKENGRVVRASETLVFGTPFAVPVALASSRVSRRADASFVGRHNGTDRGRCGRKGRKSYQFSKSRDVHVAATRFGHFSYNFCWPVRTLRVKGTMAGIGRERRRWPPA